MVKDLMQKTATQTGLQVFVSINNKFYQTGEKTSDGYKDNMTIIFDDYLPMWNYTAVPINKQVSPFYSLVSMQDNIQLTKETLKHTIETLKQNFPGIHLD